MRHIVRATALVLLVALFAMQDTTTHAAPKDGDWKSGWNTWKEAKEGDWVKYQIGKVAGVRRKVTKVSGKNITFEHTTFDAKGVETSSREFTRTWDKIKQQGRLPYGDIPVEWGEEEVEVGDKTLQCDVAEWHQGTGKEAAHTKLYFCKDIPCGGIVKMVTNGNATFSLTGYGKDGEGAEEDPKDPEPEVKSKLPRFYAAVGNKAVIKISGAGRDATYQLRTITDVAEESSTWTIVACDKEGKPDGTAAPREMEQTKKDWDATYAKPTEAGVTITVEAGEFECDVFKESEEEDKEITDWISEGLPVKKTIKIKGRETTLELVSYTMK